MGPRQITFSSWSYSDYDLAAKIFPDDVLSVMAHVIRGSNLRMYFAFLCDLAVLGPKIGKSLKLARTSYKHTNRTSSPESQDPLIEAFSA